METAKKKHDRLWAFVLMGTFLVGTASPGLASEAASPGLEPKPTLSAAASLKVEATSHEALSEVAVQDAAATPAAGNEGFFKSGKGKAAMVLMVVAVGVTVFSKYNDRVKSVIR